MRAMCDSIGTVLTEDAVRELAEHATFRLRQLLQDAEKYTKHGKRQKLLCDDVDNALRLVGQEPLYGCVAAEHEPFRFASGGGREIHFSDEKELDLQALISGPAPKIPLGVSLRAHWLAVDGVQPAIPENPPAQAKEQLRSEATNPLGKLKKDVDAMGNKLGSLTRKPIKLKTTETVSVKQLAKHELSVEQQLYYKEITEACVGSDEPRRAEALQSLACDPGLHQMLPRLCTFIAEGVRVNVVQHNLAILIYLMRMVKSLLENQTLFLEKYLHELIPAVITCLVAKQLCTRPDQDNHWALRDFASRLMTNICENFNTSTNNIQTRTTRMFSESIKSDKTPLVSCYGALAGLQQLGPEVIKSIVIPQLRNLSARLDAATGPNISLSSNPELDKTAVKNIRALIVKSVSPVLKATRALPDIPEEYVAEYGSLGLHLYEDVLKKRRAAGQQNVPKNQSPQIMNNPQQPQPRYVLMNNAQPGGQPVMVSTQGGTQQRVFLATTSAAGQQQQQQPRMNFGIQQHYQPPPNM